MNITVLAVVAVYLLVMLYIGYSSSKKIKSNEDFMVAGRRLGPVMMAGTLAATEVGGGSSLGVVEKAYSDWGMSAIWYVWAMAITFIIIALFAPKLRRAMVKTVPEFFRRRYGEAPGFITAIIMMLPLIGITAGQIIASAVVFSVMTGMSYSLSVVIVTVIITAYSVMGGLWSITITDFIQMIMIIVGMSLAIPFTLKFAGGWESLVADLPYEKMSFTEGIGIKTIVALIIMYTASFSVGQEAVQRYYAAKDEKTAVLGSLLAGSIYILFAFIPVLLGLFSFVLVQNGIIDGAMIMENGARYALPTLAIETMPPLLTGVLFAGLISATMSSADSDMLGAGSIFSNDIYRVYFNKKASDREVLNVTRIALFIVAIFSMIIALTNTRSIINILMFSFTLRAGGAFLPYVVGHYWKKASWAGALASLAAGSITVFLVERGVVSLFGFDSIIPGLIVSLIVFVLFSILFPCRKSDPLLLD